MWTWQFTVPWHCCRHLKVFWILFFFFLREKNTPHTKIRTFTDFANRSFPLMSLFIKQSSHSQRRNSNENFLSAFGDHRELVPSMTKCGSDTQATAFPCAWPLRPHVFHTHFAVSLFFLASSRHRYFRKDFLWREANVCSERSCLMLLH